MQRSDKSVESTNIKFAKVITKITKVDFNANPTE